MAQIEVGEVDLRRLNVILTAMKKGKWELEGEEVLAFAQCFHWAAELQGKIKTALVPAPIVVEPEPTAKKKKPNA
jgi:hypothetical protein